MKAGTLRKYPRIGDDPLWQQAMLAIAVCDIGVRWWNTYAACGCVPAQLEEESVAASLALLAHERAHNLPPHSVWRAPVGRLR